MKFMDLTNLNKDRQSRRKTTLDLSTMVYGKVPPQAREMEEAILGIALMERDAFDQIAARVKEESFYIDAHQRIFRAMLSLSAQNKPIDIYTVIEELKYRKELDMVGGPYFVTKITNAVTGYGNTSYYCEIVQDKFLQRELIRFAGEIIGMAYEDGADVKELLEQAEENILGIGSRHIHNDMVSINNVIPAAFKQIEKWRVEDTPLTGIPSGIQTIDRATRGWQPGDFIILAARPSVGKTALALQLARNATQSKLKIVKVGFWSLEMDSMQLVFRLLSAQGDTALQRLQTGRLDDEQMEHLWSTAKVLARDNIFFDDKGNLNLFSFTSKLRRLIKKHGVNLAIIDYLQLMTGDGKAGSREQEVSKISRGLKNAARDNRIPIIALSQLSRAVESRSGKKREPMLADLRESGSLEQDADVVVMLWGPEDEEIAQDASLAGKRYYRIAKQRNGVLIRGELEFSTHTQVLTEVTPAPEEIKPAKSVQGWLPIAEANAQQEAKLFIQAGAGIDYRAEDDEDDDEKPPF